MSTAAHDHMCGTGTALSSKTLETKTHTGASRRTKAKAGQRRRTRPDSLSVNVRDSMA